VISVYDGAIGKVINPFADLVFLVLYLSKYMSDGIGNIWMAYSDGLKTLNNKNQWTEYQKAGDFVYSISKDDSWKNVVWKLCRTHYQEWQ
jgi:hypothetical protein